MSEQKEPTVEGRTFGIEEMHRVKAQNAVAFYANNVQIGFSAFDVWLSLGEIVGEREGRPVVAEHARVTMSHAFFKAFVDLVNQNLAAFEKQVGPIQMLDMKKLAAALQPEE
jgi:hypothetical protein